MRKPTLQLPSLRNWVVVVVVGALSSRLWWALYAMRHDKQTVAY